MTNHQLLIGIQGVLIVISTELGVIIGMMLIRAFMGRNR